jgi:hypothetical protein
MQHVPFPTEAALEPPKPMKHRIIQFFGYDHLPPDLMDAN